MSADKRPPPVFIGNVFDGLKRLPDLRGAVEALILFLVVVAAGVWAAASGVLEPHPLASRSGVLTISLSTFFVPSLAEELVFRGWLKKGAPIAASLSLIAYVLWHPVQVWLGLPFGRPEFLDPRFLSLVAWLGLACTLSRIRSGSIWPAVVIHWGVVVVWIALYAS